MVMDTGTLSIEETFLGPQALPPPPTRHALFAILIALAVLLHFGTIGIGDLYSETEGQYAAAAREMIQSGQYLLPTNDSIPRLQKPPLLYWLIVASYKLFGINTAATRVPIAFSVVATVAFTFLIGERLADYWRGFAAGLIYLTLTGTFIFFGGLICYFFSPSSDRGICGSKSILTGRFITSSLTSGLNICWAAILTGIGTTTFHAGNFSPAIWPGGFPGRWRFCRR